MPIIRFSIGTQSFTLSCEEGEEGHIRQLEKSVNERFETIQRTFGSAGNQLVMAVTMLMMEEDIQKLQQGKQTSMLLESPIQPASSDAVAREEIEAELYSEVAEKLENLAQRIENR